MSQVYNGLPDIMEASEALSRLENGYLSELSQLLVKYGLQSRIGISLVHRHFTLAQEEQLVDLISAQGENVVSSVFRNGLPDNQIVKDYNLRVPDFPTIVPSKFIVRQSGLIPYEYSCVQKEQAKAFNTLDRLDSAFITGWVETLERLGIVDILGLTLLEGTEGTSLSLEKSYPDRRVSISCQEVGEMGDYIPSAWYIASDGEPTVCWGCSDCISEGED